ncbi:PucR family transcriptional regulator [Cryptosporangium arvum]|uniref:PucR family transcriptional regulator n=1 Tax=Cryptosporangium arvum TaxID=80871 RepID=UPI0004B91CEF|nr:helix-turn-helix domain-containing protein [Cryptosporangium arvum]
MKGLLLRLSALDADAEAAVRVIAYFDALVEHRATAAALVRATAGLAECPCGLERPDGPVLRYDADGEPAAAGGAASGAIDFGGGRLWLERPGGPAPLDELVLERASLAARVLLVASPRVGAPHLADPALVELVLSGRESAADRTRALRLLGLEPGRPVRVVAVTDDRGRDSGAEAVALVARGRPVRSVRVAVIGGVAAVLLQRRDGSISPAEDLRTALSSRVAESPAGKATGGGIRVGVGGNVDGLAAETSWAQARLALRFASAAGGPVDAVVDHDELGPLALLADIPTERLREQPDVRALDAHARTDSGALDVAALEAFCRTGSLRQAATTLYLHHSSVAARLAHVEDALGWHLDDPRDRFRAQLALWARRLSR